MMNIRSELPKVTTHQRALPRGAIVLWHHDRPQLCELTQIQWPMTVEAFREVRQGNGPHKNLQARLL
jgi:hypothetical protein